MEEMVKRSALELGALIRQGEVTSEEVTRTFLNRIPERQASLGAFALFTPETAIRAAKKADKRRQKEGPENRVEKTRRHQQ